MTRAPKRQQKPGRLRIIGGEWRGRKLDFIAEEGLRPTSDRIRETLFNWLAPSIHGARCADLFTGSGALGLEALSRGATHCVFVDTSSVATRQLTAHLCALDAEQRACCYTGDCTAVLQTTSGPFDIVFLDPPFNRDLVAPVVEQLVARDLLAPQAMIYVETAAKETPPAVPASWRPHREKTAGGVAYRLYAYEPK